MTQTTGDHQATRWQLDMQTRILELAAPVMAIGVVCCAGLIVGCSDSHSKTTIDQILDTPTDFAFHEEPIADFAKALEKRYGLPIRASHDAIPESRHFEPVIDCDIKNVPLRVALKSALNEHDLDFLLKDEVVLIVTTEEYNTSRRESVSNSASAGQ